MMAIQKRKIVINNDYQLFGYFYVWCDEDILKSIQKISGVAKTRKENIPGKYAVYIDPRFDTKDVRQEIMDLEYKRKPQNE